MARSKSERKSYPMAIAYATPGRLAFKRCPGDCWSTRPDMSKPSPIPLAGAIAGDTFRNLVRQFSQELCFYRELIQNALDASTNRVDVWLEYDPDCGLAIAHVQDFG